MQNILKISSALAFALVAVSAPAQAQQSPVSAAIDQVDDGNSVLAINGQGQVTSAPDIAHFSTGVTTTAANAQDALAQNARQMTRVIDALRRAGIAQRDIQTGNISLNPVFNNNRNRPSSSGQNQTPEIVGYRANNSLNIRQRDLENYGELIDALVTAGANRVNGPNFGLEDDSAQKEEALKKAVADARRKAELYASAAGLRVKGILSIIESQSYVGPQNRAFAIAEDAASVSTPVAAGELSISANIQISFELTPN